MSNSTNDGVHHRPATRFIVLKVFAGFSTSPHLGGEVFPAVCPRSDHLESRIRDGLSPRIAPIIGANLCGLLEGWQHGSRRRYAREAERMRKQAVHGVLPSCGRLGHCHEPARHSASSITRDKLEGLAKKRNRKSENFGKKSEAPAQLLVVPPTGRSAAPENKGFPSFSWLSSRLGALRKLHGSLNFLPVYPSCTTVSLGRNRPSRTRLDPGANPPSRLQQPWRA